MTDKTFAWTDKVKDVREKGVLGMQLYAIMTEPAGSPGSSGQDHMQAIIDNIGPHLAYQKQLEATGIMFAAGPFADDSEENWSGAGMVIIRAETLEAAHDIAAADPMHKSGARTFRIRSWLLNEGSLNLRITYSDGKREIS
jgi:uncharacterized protein YciI